MGNDLARTKRFPGSVSGAVEAARWVEEIATAEGFAEDLTFGIQVCVEELFTNTVRHGGGEWPGVSTAAGSGAPPLTVSLSLARGKDTVTLLLEDNGPPFDVSAAASKPVAGSIEEIQPGGLGILLVRTFASDLTYRHAGGLNHTTLTFRLH
jgi:anti-sigma regulatory factor (Ser/Thr protein kinase)